jgi:two-component system phosphate regulon sensor histidine kinase PhoR
MRFNDREKHQEGDSINTIVYHSSNNKVFDFLAGVDSLQDSITVRDVSDRYKQALAREGIPVQFHIKTFKNDSTKEFDLPDMIDNKVTVGFTRPVTYELELNNISWYIIKKLRSQLFFSLLLVGITLLSFLLLYRNLLKQKRLAELKSNFISNITHELKTPIATVNVAIEALRNFGGIQDPEKTREYLDISASELQRLSLLVDKILKLSMFENREIKLSKEEFDLKELIQEVISTLKFRFERHNASMNFTTEGETFIIDGDKLHLTSVIYNLLDNALKYSKENPVIHIYLSARRENILELKIADNGIGIAREYQSKIFDKFFRVPTNNRHDVKGYGLGLSYVSEIIKRHMGFIRVESELGKGSTFIAIIPVREAPVIYIDEHSRIIKKTIKIS